MSRVMGRMAVASLLFCWLALPAVADGLSRFEEAMKEAPAGTLAYKSAKALGETGRGDRSRPACRHRPDHGRFPARLPARPGPQDDDAQPARTRPQRACARR